MKVVSVNIGEPQTYPWRGGTCSSIVKQPQKEAVALDVEGFVGNAQADLKNHGGRDKAVLLLPAKNYALLGLEPTYGFLGENLTLLDLDETQVSVGDRLKVGEVLLEVTQPRSPCWKLSALTDNPHFTRQYAESGRVGFYCRVLQSGKVVSGDTIEFVPSDFSPRVDVQTLFLAKYAPKTDEQWKVLQVIVQHPALSNAWREAIQKQLSLY